MNRSCQERESLIEKTKYYLITNNSSFVNMIKLNTPYIGVETIIVEFKL